MEMVFKYNFIRFKGKGRKDGSKGYLKLIVKFLLMDKEKMEERKGDILEEFLGWYRIFEYFLLFEFMEEEKMENVEEEESEKEEDDVEGREMGEKRRKRRKLRRKRKRGK